MIKYTAAQAANLVILKKGRHTYVHKQLLQLLPGEALLIEKGKDWISKSPPYKLIDRLAKKHNMHFERGRDENKKGWNVKRIK